MYCFGGAWLGNQEGKVNVFVAVRYKVRTYRSSVNYVYIINTDITFIKYTTPFC